MTDAAAIPVEEEVQQAELVPLDAIEVTDWNPRKEFTEKDLSDLQASIEALGLKSPIKVRPKAGEPGRYQLVYGERRLRVFRRLGRERIPAIVEEMDDRAMRATMFVENLQRKDLEPLEYAQAIEEMMTSLEMSQEEIAAIVGKHQSWVSNMRRLLKAPEEIRGMLICRQISPKHVHAFLPYAEYPISKPIIARLRRAVDVDGAISVKQFESMIKECIDSYQVEEDDLILTLDNFRWEISKWQPFFDFTGCEGCRAVVEVEEHRRKNKRLCLDRSCFGPRLEAARVKFEEDLEKKKEKIRSGEGVNVDTLSDEVGYRSWTYLRHQNFDFEECKTSCDKCKLDERSADLVCLDPACAQRKEAALSKERNKREREEWKKVHDVVNEFFEAEFTDLSPKVLKTLIEAAAMMWKDSAQKGLRPWGPVDRVYELTATARKVPEKDAAKALARIWLFNSMRHEGKKDVETARKFLEEVVA